MPALDCTNYTNFGFYLTDRVLGSYSNLDRVSQKQTFGIHGGVFKARCPPYRQINSIEPSTISTHLSQTVRYIILTTEPYYLLPLRC